MRKTKLPELRLATKERHTVDQTNSPCMMKEKALLRKAKEIKSIIFFS
jgi:hypothetical protein